MSQRKKAGRRARRAARRIKVKAAAQKAAPVVQRIYKAGGKDAIELAAGLVPGGAIAAKGLTKGIDLFLSRPERTKKAKAKAKPTSSGLGYSIQADDGLAIAPEPEGSEVAISSPWYKQPKILATAAAAVLLGVVAMARRKKAKR